MKAASCLVIALTTLAACTDDSTAFEPDQVRTGIYKLDAVTTTDTCDPPRFTGSATVPLSKLSAGISIADAANASTSFPLLPSEGYALRLPTAGLRLDPCAPSNNSVVFNYVLTGASSDRVDVVEDESWTIATACPATSEWFVDSSIVPRASCTATRELHYTLISACASPCVITPAPACSCP